MALGYNKIAAVFPGIGECQRTAPVPVFLSLKESKFYQLFTKDSDFRKKQHFQCRKEQKAETFFMVQ